MSSTPMECPACGSISKTVSDVCEICGFMLPKVQDAPARVEARPAPAAPPLEDDLIELPLEAEVKVKTPHIVPNPVRNGSPPPRAPAAAAAEAQKAAQAKADAQRQQQLLALKQQQAAMANVLAQRNEAQAQAQAKPAAAQPATEAASGAKTVQLLKKYEGQAIGINYNNSADIREAELAQVNSDYFTVIVKEKKLRFTFPLRTLLSVIEGEDGVEVVVGGTAVKMKVVLKVYPLVLF
jgi:hypothetical protein